MKSKFFIALAILFIVGEFSYLSWTEYRLHDYDHEKNWWVLYFENPKESSMAFSIENHGDTPDFHWQILLDQTVVKEGDVSITKGLTKTIPVTVSEIENKQIHIIVSKGDEKKEIYKNL